MLGRGERQLLIRPVDPELEAAERLVGPAVALDPLADPHGTVQEAARPGPPGEGAQRDAGPGHVAHGGAGEAELRPDIGRAVRPHEAVGLERAVVEGVRPDVVGLPEPAVVVRRVVALGMEQRITQRLGPGQCGGGPGREVGEDHEGVVVGERGAEQAGLVGVALGQAKGAVVGVGVHGGGEEGQSPGRGRGGARAGGTGREGLPRAGGGEPRGTDAESGTDERTPAERRALSASHGSPLRALSISGRSLCWRAGAGSTLRSEGRVGGEGEREADHSQTISSRGV
ncbi:hypothetical protein HNR57_005182 [Streptomyces paradoxus]|uniref:Uncharacterized protein n=1 Tax=Streptomyces paradoxus TaxID=66375 RepID=A0A7W9TEM4_9ACTN|nr:hypothetical protein [Streptomyces paradoxus]